jgi:hypothetical protein
MGWEMIPSESMSGFQYTEKTGCSNCLQLSERIKVLEDALKYYRDRGDRPHIARAALEVKP